MSTTETNRTPAPRRATIADVARAAGVSGSTASVVFSGKTKVSDATRQRVLDAAAELGYAGPDPRAASLRTGRSGIVAVVLEEHLRTAFLDPVKTATMDGLTDALATLGSGVLLLRHDPGGENPVTLDTAPVDAVVLLSCTPRTYESLDVIRARGLPVVVIEGDGGADAAHVELDSDEASAQLNAHLRDLGHEDVAIVTLPFGLDLERGFVTEEQIARIRVEITARRLRDVRQAFPDAQVVQSEGSFIDEGVLAGRLLLDVPEDGPRRRPTAIIAQSDLLAAGVVRAAEELGLRVPEDVSVTGFDGVEVDGLGGHVLTTVVQPSAEKGRAAGAAVARMLRGEPASSQLLNCTFRIGTTTGPAPLA